MSDLRPEVIQELIRREGRGAHTNEVRDMAAEIDRWRGNEQGRQLLALQAEVAYWKQQAKDLEAKLPKPAVAPPHQFGSFNPYAVP